LEGLVSEERGKVYQEWLDGLVSDTEMHQNRQRTEQALQRIDSQLETLRQQQQGYMSQEDIDALCNTVDQLQSSLTNPSPQVMQTIARVLQLRVRVWYDDLASEWKADTSCTIGSTRLSTVVYPHIVDMVWITYNI
jgi:response regulator of citrate/malate metabolism